MRTVADEEIENETTDDVAGEAAQEVKENPLGTDSVGRLLTRYAVPSVIALLVSSLYNIVDQIFIGNYVGELGNAATSVAFPLTTLCLSVAMLFGLGGASAANLAMGRGDKEDAPGIIANCAEMLLLCGLVIMAVTLIFLMPLLRLFGASETVLPYAQDYVGITAIGFPFYVFSTGGGHLIRATGRPRGSMTCILTGAIINIALDTIFVVVLGWGISGAAWATVIGQIVSAILALVFLMRPKSMKISRRDLVPKGKYIGGAAKLGIAPCITQLANMVVQITLNNSLKRYGGESVYGEDIPVAVVGVITKVNQVYLSILGGVAQGVQPIASYNYGAKKFDRVRKVFVRALIVSIILGVITFVLFQTIPRQITSLFGSGSEEYYEFAESYFRIYLSLAFINFLPQLSSNFFTAIGKPVSGTIMSLTRQILFFLPLLLIFPLIWGIDGILYVGPVADSLAVAVAIVLLVLEFRKKIYRNGVEPPAEEGSGGAMEGEIKEGSEEAGLVLGEPSAPENAAGEADRMELRFVGDFSSAISLFLFSKML